MIVDELAAYLSGKSESKIGDVLSQSPARKAEEVKNRLKELELKIQKVCKDNINMCGNRDDNFFDYCCYLSRFV